MFDATKATIRAELWVQTQGYVNRIHSAVRTRLSSLNHRVTSLESELRSKAEVVQILETRIAELEKGSLLRPERPGDLQHVEDQLELGPPAQVHRLLAIEDDGKAEPSFEEGEEAAPSFQEDGQAAPSPQEDGEAAPSPQEDGEAAPSPQEDGEAVPLPQEDGEAAPLPQEDGEATLSSDMPSSDEHGAAGGRGTVPSNTTTKQGPGAGTKCSSERKSSLEQTSVYNTTANPGLGAGTKCSSERKSSLEQTLVYNTIANPGLGAGSNFLVGSPPTTTHLPQLPLNLSATPTRVIRKVRDEVEATEARILDLSTRRGPASQR